MKAIIADLGDKAALAKVEALLRDDKSITMLVNNAGTAALTPPGIKMSTRWKR